MKRLVFYLSLQWLLMLLIISNISNAQLYTSYNHSASAGVNVPSIVTPSYGGQYFNRWGVHYSACELPLKAGARITQIQFKLNTAPTSTTPFIVRIKLKNAGDTNPLCQLQYPDSWTDVYNDNNPIIECVGSFNSLDTTLKLNLPTSLGSPSFIYLGSGLEILSDSSTGDNSIPFKGYRDEQNMGLWKGNLFEALLNVKPIVKFQYTYPALQNFSGAEISNCSGANRFSKRQDVCFFIANWRMNNTQASSPNNTYQWQICSSTSPNTCYLTTSPQLITTTNSIELTSDIMQQLLVLNTSGSFVLKCTWNYASVPIASFSFSIVDDVSTSPQITNPNDSISSKITHVKFLKRPDSSAEFQPILESVSNMDDGTFTHLEYFNQLESSGDLPDLAMQNISLVNFPNQLTPQLFANIQNTADAIPVLRPGEELRMEVTMNKGMKPMLNHRMYINMDLDANQRFDSLIVLKLEETNSGYTVPINWSGNDFIDLAGGSSDTIRYQTQLFIPCDWVKDIPIKIRTGLGRLPTGWDDEEEYTIKTLCPTPLIAYSGADTVCVNAVLPFTALAPIGCAGTFEWFDANGQSVGTNSSFTPTTSGTYTVKFTTEDCIKSSLPITIVILPLVLQYADADGDGFGDLNADTLSCDTLDGYVLNGNDCNDANALLHTVSVEICNGFDDDCDGSIDEGTAVTPSISIVSSDTDNTICQGTTVLFTATAINGGTAPSYQWKVNGVNTGSNSPTFSTNTLVNGDLITVVLTANNTCQTSNTVTSVGISMVVLTVNTYYADDDGDGYGDFYSPVLACIQPPGSVFNADDCNDANDNIHEGAVEICNDLDDDCDGIIDNGLLTTYYEDVDGDGFGAGAATNACQSPGPTYTTNNNDCNDGASAIHPGATEVCNAIDDDCDATADDGLTFVNYYNDADGDGFGAGAATNACQSPGLTYVTSNTDCNDGTSTIYPGAAEACNAIDDDCDGTADDGLTFVNYYNDVDGDGFGAGAATNACQSPGPTYTTNNNDCNDGASAIHPGATEVCNTVDDDCDGTTDDGLIFVNYYNDVDGDGFGAGTASNLCANPGAGNVTNNNDCNDAAATIFPGATEACNTVDDDCDALVDEGCSIGAALLTATSITSLPQFGLTGGNYSQNINMALESDTPENGGNYPEKWFKFVAQSNAVRIALTGASTADDNAIAIYDDPGLSYSSPLIPIALEDDVNLSSTGVTDQGNEILLTDQLVEGNTYYVVVATVGGTPGMVNVKFNTLLPSSCDIAAYTGGTNTYSNVCSNFKCRYRQNAKRAILNRWSTNSITGMPLQSYTIPPTTIMYTVCQLSKFVPANISAISQTIYVSADVQYELLDAAGNMNYLTAISNSTCSFTLNPEAYINLRSSDACPNFKSTTSSLATDRSVCGTSQYQWEFTQAFPVVGLPFNVNGSLGGSRILNVSGIPGVANGQRYDLRIRSLHNDNVTYSGWSLTSSCFKTLGAAGMAPWTHFESEHYLEKDGHVIVYPNPSLVGLKAQLQSKSELTAVELYSNSGQLLARLDGLSQIKSIDLPAIEVSGLYWVVAHAGNDSQRIAWLIQ